MKYNNTPKPIYIPFLHYLQKSCNKTNIDVAHIKTCLDNIQLPGVLVKDSTALLDEISQDEVKEAIACLNYQ